MERDKEIAAILAGPGDDAAKLRAMAALAAKPFKAKKAEDDKDDEEEAAEDDKDKSAEDEKEDEKAEDDKDKSASAQHDGFAVLRLPEARGREQLAATLGEKVSAGKLTVAEAKSMLADVPKASRLSDAMAGRDKNPGADAAKAGSGKGLAAAVDRMVAGMTGGKPAH